jgi:ubiquitin carboxyl-terminal hydrolase 9/24
MEEEEEMKSQCFGGDYLGEVFDHMLKRMSYRKQKRWWNAYMLFYTRLDVEENSLMKSVNELSLCKLSLRLLYVIELDECIAFLLLILIRYETRGYENAASDRT